MTSDEAETKDTTVYTVVVNHEEQYSIWPSFRDIPPGWKSVGNPGTKEECLAYVKEHWTDMRPLSLRKQMEEEQTRPPVEPAVAPPEDNLIERLSEGKHAVVASLRPESSSKALKERIELGYVHIKFTETWGGTELGVRLDSEASDSSGADFENGTGSVHLEGGLTLNFVKVRCVADIDLATLGGTGRLAVIDPEDKK